VQRGRQSSLAQSSASDRRDARATGEEPPRYRLRAGVSVTNTTIREEEEEEENDIDFSVFYERVN